MYNLINIIINLEGIVFILKINRQRYKIGNTK